MLLSVPVHRAEWSPAWRYPSSSTLAVVSCRSRVFNIRQFTLLWRIHICGLLDWVCSESYFINSLLSKWNGAGFVLCYDNFDLFLQCCPQNFWALQQHKWFWWVFHFVKTFLKNQIPQKHLTKLKQKLEVCWRMFVYSQGTDEKMKCAVHIFLLPIERELHSTQWKTTFFIVCFWSESIKGFTMIHKSRMLWSYRNWSIQSKLRIFFLFDFINMQ